MSTIDTAAPAALYLLRYDRAPRLVAGDVAIVHDDRDATVVTSSEFRLTEARRTDREMTGPYADRDEALGALGVAFVPFR